MTMYDEVLFSEMAGNAGDLGIITLNRPEVLNSLNHAMVQAMQAQLNTWAQSAHIKAIVIRASEGRAFCAGGDLRTTYDRHKTHDRELALFFRDEYHLNKTIFHYPKPYIAFWDGITMGGGVGISIHGSHRIATERLMFAMPETGIGFFPDVGGTHFLPRLPNKMGYYLGLTGARIKVDEAVGLGIATHKASGTQLKAILDALSQTDFSRAENPKAAVDQVLEQFQEPLQASNLLEHKALIESCFTHETVEDILQALDGNPAPICQESAKVLLSKSPTSLKVSLQAMQFAAHMDFDTSMSQEYRLVCHFLQEHDFAEGIRAVIIDKDQQPKWQPPTLQEVTKGIVQKYFAPVTRELA